MKLALISQSLGGSACALFGLWIVKPEWFGTYYDVELYAVYVADSQALVATDTTVTASKEATTPTKDNERKMECWVTGQENYKYDCDIFESSTAITETNNFIDASVFLQPKTTINSTAPTDKKYYKISVTKKLWEETRSSTNKTIEIQKTESSTTDKKWTLKPIALNEDGSYELFDSSPTKYYVVQVKKDDEKSATTEINIGTDFKCSYNKKSDINDCEIEALTTNSEGESSIESIKFEKNKATKIKENHFYLLKTKHSYENLFVKDSATTNVDGGTNNNNFLKLNIKGEALLWTNNNKTKLIYFKTIQNN